MQSYFKVNEKTNISQAQTMAAYLGGSAFQTVVDNPITAYRQLVQQYAKNLDGKIVDPKIATSEASAVFRTYPIGASLSGLGPRLVGVGFKRIPKFGFLLGYSFISSNNGKPGMYAATFASIASAPFINPVRMIEKQQRAYFKQTGQTKSILSILQEARAKKFRPLFRGTIPLMGHSLASATLGLVGQPQLEQYIKESLADSNVPGSQNQFIRGLMASSAVTPFYVILTNPISRLEVIMQTSSIKKKPISLVSACKELLNDSKSFGLRGIFRGQGIGMAKGIISLTMFHQGRLFLMDNFKDYNSYNINFGEV